MTAPRTSGLLAILLFSAFLRAQDLGPLRARLDEGLKSLGESEGYAFSGRFVYKRGGRETVYRASRFRRGETALAEFTADDPTWNMKFGAAGQDAWAASPEAVARIGRKELPAVVRYDFAFLAAELRTILSRGSSDPDFRAGADGNELYVRGRLSDGNSATFLLDFRHSRIRKVSVRSASPLPAWYFVVLERGVPALVEPGGVFGEAVEVWFSEFGDSGELFLPRRADFVDGRGVAGTWFDEGPRWAGGVDAAARTPPEPGWTRQSFTPGTNLRKPALFRSDPRLEASHGPRAPSAAAAGRRLNALIAPWSVAAPWLAVLLPAAPGPRVFAIGMAFGLAGAAALLILRRRRFGTRLLKPAAWVIVVFALAGAAGIASIHLNSPQLHGLLALHGSIRYALTGTRFLAPSAGRYFERLPGNDVSSVDLARAVARFAAAYDLSCDTMGRPAQARAEAALFAYSRPLSGVLRGCRAHSWDAAIFASSLGIAGLAIGRESWVTEARDALRRAFAEQFVGGVHAGGPGRGVAALNDSMPFLRALRTTGQPDAGLEESWRAAAGTTLQLVSPVGTLPLFGETSLDQSSDAALLFAKAEAVLPEESARRCAAAAQVFWDRGRHWSSGFSSWFRSSRLRLERLAGDPLTILLADGALPPSAPPGSSFVGGQRSVAVLRSGSGPDSLFVAVNAIPPTPERTVRDALSIEMYGGGALLLGGAGYPATRPRDQAAAARTSAHNTVSIRGREQSADGWAEITAALLNQPRFDFVRATGENLYEDGSVRRDVVLVRPGSDFPAYAILVDEVRTAAEEWEVDWRLAGPGDLAIGLAQNHLWTARSIGGGIWRRPVVRLGAEVFGNAATPRSARARLFFRDPGFDAAAEALVVGWRGSRRIGALLLPRRENEPAPVVERSQSGETVRVGPTDRISLGSPDSRVTSGPLSHVSDFTVVRDRGAGFPAVLLVNGTELRYNAHVLRASAPVVVSLEGFRGAVRSSQPEVRVEILSPTLKAGTVFQLDGVAFEAGEGSLVLQLATAGSHTLK